MNETPGISSTWLPAQSRIDTSQSMIASSYAGCRLMVTGAGGTIGSELCRQLLACRPDQILLCDQSEAALYTIDKDLRRLRDATGQASSIVPLLASVADRRSMQDALTRHDIDTIFHSAAFKHVPLVEANPIAGIENNIFGTRTLAEAAVAAGTARFVLVSTDKAVRPVGVMGATKRLAEMAVQDLCRRSPATRFSIVRFGNVLDSSGSVVPLFREQIERGGPVTLTHAAMTRYFMTLTEASQLVLIVGAFPASPQPSADVFVLDMGPPVRISDLAVQMIEAAGLRPRDDQNLRGDIEIRVVGLRPGEKLHEELLIDQTCQPTSHPLVLRAGEPGLTEFETAQAFKALRAAVIANDADEARRQLFRWVEPASQVRSLAEA